MSASVYTYTNPPIGLDFELLNVQNQLACLSFMQAIYGVARTQIALMTDDTTNDKFLISDFGRKGNLRYERSYPQSRYIDQDIDLTIDDSYISRGFFVLRDPSNVSPKENSWEATDSNVEVVQPLSFIFHCNINKVNNFLNSSLNQESIKTAILFALNKCFQVKVHFMYENTENVWKEYSITETVNSFNKYPNYLLKIDFDLYYYAFPNNNNGNFDPSSLYTASFISPNSDNSFPNVN